MIKKRKKNPTRKIIFILVPFLAIFGILGYYQLLYRSPRVDSGIAKLETIFTSHKNSVQAVRFSPDGNLVASGSVDSTVKVWKKQTGEIVLNLKHPDGVTCLEFSPDGKYIATGSYDAKVRLWNINDGTLAREYAGSLRTVWSVSFSPDGKTLAGSGEDATIYLWDAVSGNLTTTLKGHTLTIWSIKFSPDGKKIASGSFDHSLKIWNVSDGKLLKDIEGHTQAIVGTAFSRNGEMIASTSDDETIKLWNVNDGTLVRTMKAPEHIYKIAFSPDDNRLLTGGADKPLIGEFLQNIFGDSKYNKGVSARLWDVKSGALLQTFAQHGNEVNDVAYSEDGKWIATASSDKTVHVWHLDK